MSAVSHAGHTRKQAIPRTKRDRPTARDTPAEDRKTSASASHGEVRYERNLPFSRGKATEQQSFSMNVYTTEDPASIYTRGPGGAGEQPRPRWTPEDRIVILPGLRSDPKIKDYNRVSGDMEPDTSWTIEAVDSETSEKEETLNVQLHDHTPGARSAVIDESDREEILYPRNLGATPSKSNPQSDSLIPSSHDTPKRPLLPEIHHSPSSLSTSVQQTRNPKNDTSSEFELAQTGSRISLPQRAGSTPTVDKPKNDIASTRKHRNFNANTPSARDGKGKEHRRESAGLTTNTLKSPPIPGKTPERPAMRTSRSSSSSNFGDGHHARRLHTTDLSHLPASPSPSTKQRPLLTPNTPTAQLPPLPHPPQDPPNPNAPPNAPPHSPLRAGAQQEGWSSLDDVATADALRKLDLLAGQRARARVHSFGRPGTAAGSPVTPAGRISPGREAVGTSDSGKSKRDDGGVKGSPFFLMRPVRKSSTSKDTHLPVPPPSLVSVLPTDISAPAPTQVDNPPKTLDHTAHAGAATPAPATSTSTNPPHPSARGPPSSAHRSRPKRVSPSAIPVFRRASSQSAQLPPASASDGVSSASQNTRSTKTNEVRSPAGASAGNGGAGVAPSPPVKPAVPSKIVWKARHHRSSSAPLSVPQPNSTANETATRRPTNASSSHASLTSTTNTSPRVRRGYWNRRGDHLTPDGHVVYAPPALAYPTELAAYPREEAGYRDEQGGFLAYAERPELGASLPCKGRAPKRPYESFVVYVDDAPRPHWWSIDPFPRGLTPPKHTAKRTPHKKSPPTTTAKQNSPKAESPSLALAPLRPDPWDLDAILAAHRARRPRSPTSSSSSYGSAHSTRSRASSFSGSAGGHIPGTSRDVMEFPFGYPPAN